MATLSVMRRFLPWATIGVAIVTATPWVVTGDWVAGAVGFVGGLLASLLFAWQFAPYLEARDARRAAQS